MSICLSSDAEFSQGPAHRSRFVCGLLTVVLLLTLAAMPAWGDSDGQGASGQGNVPPRFDGAGFENVMDPAIQYFAMLGLLDWSRHPTPDPRIDLDAFHTLDHLVPLPDGNVIYMQETFTLGAWLPTDPSAVVFLAGSAFVGNHAGIPTDGYNGAQIVAATDRHVFTVDYLGTGRSSRPAHGSDAEYEDNREAMKDVLRYIRFLRGVRKIDLIGAGYGGSIAAELAEDRHRVRSVSMSAMIYREVQGGPLTDPGFIAFLRSIPTGYVLLPGNSSLIFLGQSPQSVRDFVAVTQGGLYPVDNFLVAAERPFFDPSVAKAPGQVIYGGRDFIAVQQDIENLASEYGVSGARLAINEDAGHAPRTGAPEEAAWFWSQVLDFLDNPHRN